MVIFPPLGLALSSCDGHTCCSCCSGSIQLLLVILSCVPTWDTSPLPILSPALDTEHVNCAFLKKRAPSIALGTNT